MTEDALLLVCYVVAAMAVLIVIDAAVHGWELYQRRREARRRNMARPWR